MASKGDKNKEHRKEAVAKKRKGLSTWEKVAIPLLIIIAVWSVYSFVLVPPPPSTSLTNVTLSTTVTSGLAPDFTLPVVGPNGLTGQTLTLSAFRGKIVLLEFMEPWCPHCQHMAPVMANLFAQYGKGNVVFISVAGAFSGATPSDVGAFINQYGTNWNYVYDSSGTIFSEYGVASFPTFFIIAQDGTVFNVCNQGEQCAGSLAGDLSAAGGT